MFRSLIPKRVQGLAVGVTETCLDGFPSWFVIAPDEEDIYDLRASNAHEQEDGKSKNTVADAPPTAGTTSDSQSSKSDKPKRTLLGQAGAFTSGMFSVGAKVGGAIVSPVTSLVSSKEKTKECALPPRDIKSLVGDVVLLGAPLNLRVSSILY